MESRDNVDQDAESYVVTLVMPRMDLQNRDDPNVESVEPASFDRGVETAIDDWVRTTIRVGHQSFILVAAREQGYWLPATCQQGWCTTCAARLLDGAVDNSVAHRYYDVDRKEGWILPCTAVPVSDCSIQTHLEPQFGEHRNMHDLPP